MSASIPSSSASSKPAPVSNANCTEKVKNFMTPTKLAIAGIVAGAILMIVAFTVLSKIGTISTATVAGAFVIAGLAAIIAQQVKQRQEATSKKDTASLLNSNPPPNSGSPDESAPSTTA